MLQKISTDKAPAAIGPYSQGIIVNGMLFASGQIPINPATGNVEGEDITPAVNKLEQLSMKHDVDFILSVSVDESELSADLKDKIVVSL